MSDIDTLRAATLAAVDTYVERINAVMVEGAKPVQQAFADLTTSDMSDTIKLAILRECEQRLDKIGEGVTW